MSPLLKNLIIALCITVILSVLYILFGKSDDGALTVESTMDTELFMRSQQVLNDTNTIGSYRMDVDVLKDARFTSLKNTQIDLSEAAVGTGRENPFAPVN